MGVSKEKDPVLINNGKVRTMVYSITGNLRQYQTSEEHTFNVRF